MTLGEKIKAARLEAGLSQRQLCGDTITRNMLSQIENGSARPSMQTLQFLAAQLGKPVSFFLQEQAADTPNASVMQQAREAYGRQNHAAVILILEQYQSPDPLFDQEMAYLLALASLAQAAICLQEQNPHTAATLLETMPRSSVYYRRDMELTRRQLLHRAYPMLEEHYRREKDFERAYEYACKDRSLPR